MSKKKKKDKPKLHTYDVIIFATALVETLVTVEAANVKAAKKYATLLAENEDLEWEISNESETVDNIEIPDENVELISKKPTIKDDDKDEYYSDVDKFEEDMIGMDETPPQEFVRGGYKGRK